MALRLWAWVPPRYFLPVSTLDSCFAHTSKCSHASFAVPSLKYFFDIFNQMAAVKMWVGPFLRFVGQTGGIGDGQDRLSYFLPLLFLSHLGLLIFNWVQKPLRDVELYKWVDSSCLSLTAGWPCL